MFPHPEDLHRTHLLQHAELIRNLALERQARLARADHRSTHRLREITHHISYVILRRHWWKRFIALSTRDSHRIGTDTTVQPNGASATTPPPAPALCTPERSRR